MLSVVIALLTMVAMAGGVLRLRQMRRNREVNELLLQLRTRDALLTDELLAALPIALTVHLPRAFWSPAVVEITGRVPTADLRDDVVRLVKREVSRWCIGAQTAVAARGRPADRPARGCWDSRGRLRGHSGRHGSARAHRR